MKLEPGKSRLDLVREGATPGVSKRGRLIVSVSRIVEDPKNERKTFRNMEGLIASITAVGLVEPLTVTPESGETYRIITGHRRFRAAKTAGLETVEVIIRDPQDEQERRLKSLVSNVQREDIGPVEMAEALAAMLDEHGEVATQRALALAIGKDESWVSRMLRILDLPVELQQKLRASPTSVSYDAVAAIARLTDRSEQDELVQAVLDGANVPAIRERVRQAKGLPAKNKSKPKESYHTSQGATVIVQSETQLLTPDQCLAALEEATNQARQNVIAGRRPARAAG